MSLTLEERAKYAEGHLAEALAALKGGAGVTVASWLIEDALRLLRDESTRV
jgi:hypothetical protein